MAEFDESDVKKFTSQLNAKKSKTKDMQLQSLDIPKVRKGKREKVAEASAPNAKKGTHGLPVQLTSNCFGIKFKDIHVYHVSFKPKVKTESEQRSLITQAFAQRTDWLLNGTLILTPAKLANTIVVDKLEEKGESVTIRFSLTNQRKVNLQQVFDEILKKALDGLEYTRILGDSVYESSQQHLLRNRNDYELWKGFQPMIRHCDPGLVLCVSPSYLVVHGGESVYHRLMAFTDKAKFGAAIKGCQVLTRYCDQTYTITGIDRTLTPESMFQKEGQMISFRDHFSTKYGCRTKHLDQPLLTAKCNNSNRNRDTCYLIPEFCNVIGITNRLWKSPKLMRDIKDNSRLANPEMIKETTKNFQYKLTQKMRLQFSGWKGDIVVDKPFAFKGRTLSPPKIMFNKEYLKVVDADWTNMLCTLINTRKPLFNWWVVAPNGTDLALKNSLTALMRSGKNMGMSITEPNVNFWSSVSSPLESVLDKIITKAPQMILVIVTDRDARQYSMIKRKLLVESAIPCQVDEIFPWSKLKQIMLVQMNAKLGNSAWKVESPMGFMFIGLDVRHDKVRNKQVGAFIATMDQRRSDYYFSRSMTHETDKELAVSFGEVALEAVQFYLGQHQELPKAIIVYRCNVGQQKATDEMDSLRDQLMELYKDNGQELKVVFVTVDTKQTIRFFQDRWSPPAGTVVDDHVTVPGRFDFFLTSEKTQKKYQSATATYYNVIHNSVGLSSDELHQITFAQSFMYFNSLMAIRVPAVCQYASDLAKLVAYSLHDEPNEALNGKLFFLPELN